MHPKKRRASKASAKSLGAQAVKTPKGKAPAAKRGAGAIEQEVLGERLDSEMVEFLSAFEAGKHDV
eukprot:1469134-Alexandrium_andersonii.AAC.1